MSISRAFKNSALMATLALIAACAGQAAPSAEAPTLPAPTATPESLAATAPAGTTPAGTDDIWLEQPFGPDGQLAVLFYEDGAQACVRFLVDLPGATPHSACGDPTRSALTAIQAAQADSAGTPYSILVGRVFQPGTRVVAVEMEDGQSYSVNVDGGGIILILEGERRAARAVPIDEFGNLTGEIFRFQ